MTLKLKSGGVTSTPPYVVDKGLPALIAFAASAGTMPSKNAAPNTMTCSAVSILRDSKNEMKKNRKYPDERNRFGNLKLTARPIKRPTSPVRSRRCCCRCSADIASPAFWSPAWGCDREPWRYRSRSGNLSPSILLTDSGHRHGKYLCPDRQAQIFGKDELGADSKRRHKRHGLRSSATSTKHCWPGSGSMRSRKEPSNSASLVRALGALTGLSPNPRKPARVLTPGRNRRSAFEHL